MEFNDLQSTEELLGIQKESEEIRELFYDFINNIPFILSLISINRKRAKDLPKDEEGKIIVDITLPHILEDMDYFRPAALHYLKYLCYTLLRPNSNPKSEYGKWIREEVRRCREGYVRESDGEWITGDYYYFLNYAPMLLIKLDKVNKKKGYRVIDFPRVWEGHYLLTHYLLLARDNGKHALLLASRAKGKSFIGASLLAKRFILGESAEVNKKVICYITASDRKYLDNGDLTLNKFVFDIDWAATNTLWPSKRLVDTLNKLLWTMGYKDLDTNTNKGTLNSVIGVSSAEDESKLRGSRGVLYILEECGTFPKLLLLYNNIRHSVEQGDITYGTIFAYGTAGDNESDFYATQEMMYNPGGYNMYAVDNVYDKEGTGKRKFVYFFPGYLNYEGFYDENGNSDVTGALLKLLLDRYWTKYNSTDVNAITKRIAESPIVPLEAILRARGNIFPVAALQERLNELDNDSSILNNSYVGNLVLNKQGVVEFKPSNDIPIRDFPLKDNKAHGAIEIFEMPLKDKSGKVPSNRYILGHDPVDNDVADSLSLTSTFVLDLFTDRIVAEYTGRLDYANDNFEVVRLLCMFYNGKCLYENNKKGLFAYFSTMRSTHLLAETPEYLLDKQLVRSKGYGSSAYGVNATLTINSYANELIKLWLIKPLITNIETTEGTLEVTTLNLQYIKNRALLKELILFNPDINVDRVRALGMVMLYREGLTALMGGDFKLHNPLDDASYLGNDDYFTKNYHKYKDPMVIIRQYDKQFKL